MILVDVMLVNDPDDPDTGFFPDPDGQKLRIIWIWIQTRNT